MSDSNNKTWGGARLGAGRPCKRVSLQADDQFAVMTANAEGRQQGMSELWRVVEVSRSVILFRNAETGDTIKLVR